MSASERVSYRSPAPDQVKHPTRRTNRERATGAQDHDRQVAVEASFTKRLGEIDAETRQQAAAAVERARPQHHPVALGGLMMGPSGEPAHDGRADR